MAKKDRIYKQSDELSAIEWLKVLGIKKFMHALLNPAER